MTTHEHNSGQPPSGGGSFEDHLEAADLDRLLIAARAVLEHAGWRQVGRKHRSEVWRPARGQDSVFLADSPDLGGALTSVREAVAAIAASTGQTYFDVAQQVAQPWYDHLLVRTQIEAYGYNVPLDDAANKITALRTLLLSAARAASLKAPVFKANDVPASRSYANDARLAPFSAGSFVFHGLIPITSLEQEPLFQDRASLASLRDASHTVATQTLMSALSAAASAAASRQATSTAFEAAVESGVSANLLEALADLAVDDQDEPAPIAVALRYTHDIPEPDPQPVRFDRDALVQVLRAAEVFRSGDDPVTALVVGTVASLKRRTRFGPGEASIRGQSAPLEGTRTFRFALDARSYDQIATIHAEHLLAELVCTYRLTGRNRIQVLDIGEISARS